MILVFAATALAGISLERPAAHDEETVLIATRPDGEALAGATVRVFYRRGLEGEREQAIGITDGRGRVGWTPTEPGIAEVRAADEALPVRIAPAHLPARTVGLLAAVTALGVLLAGYGSWRPGAR